MSSPPTAYSESSLGSSPSSVDLRMRRLLRVPVDGRTRDRAAAERAMSTSIAVSAVRCLLTYVALPLLRPVVDLSGGVGPLLGIVLSAVSIVAVTAAIRRFWAADHRWRWGATVLGTAILVFVVIQAAVDGAALVT